MNVEQETLEQEYCIGCGICSVVCPKQCIQMKYNQNKEYIPVIDKEKCINCGKCVIYCPHSKQNKELEIQNIKEQKNPIFYGLGNADYFWGRDSREENVLRSCSGGITTELAVQLLETNMVDVVVQATKVLAKSGEEHYKVVLSNTKEEIESNRGTVYGPLCFEKVLKQLKGKEKKILVIGVPCVIRGTVKLFRENEEFRGGKIYTIALMCSHNVNGQFIDFMGDSVGINNEKSYYANFRAKDKKMKNQNNYYTQFSDNKEVLFKENRFQSLFTKVWREYYFAMPVCNVCSDFFGRDADISLKDAWGASGDNYQYGSNMIIVRNGDLLEIIKSLKNIKLRRISKNEVVNSQSRTVEYKQGQVVKRYENIGLQDKEYLNYKNNIELSKKLYKQGGYEACHKEMLNKKKETKKVAILEKLKKEIEKKYSYQEEKNIKKILMWGGFAGVNSGDEAQIDETYKILKNRYSSYEVKILSHVQQHTWEHHNHCAVGANSRLAIWNTDSSSLYYSVASNIGKMKFLLVGFWTYINAILIRCGIPPFMINAKKVSLLYEIKTSNLIYISGGGYLTGDTLSRLWDHLFVIYIASVFDIPCVMSGHNIGLWDSEFTKKFASRGFNKVKAITTRDPEDSIKALKEIGVEGKHIFCTHDDALFCEKCEDRQMIYKLCGLDMSDKYIVLCPHTWNVNSSKQRNYLRDKLIHTINLVLHKTEYKVVVMPMCLEDQKIVNELARYMKNERVSGVSLKEYDFRITRGIIAQAQMCITMRHHPIIFAAGECVPIISLSKGNYFKQKNVGALQIFKQEKYNVKFESPRFIQDFSGLFDECMKSQNNIQQELKQCLIELKEKREQFYKMVDKYILK